VFKHGVHILEKTKIERVQRRATKLIKRYRNMAYCDRLNKTGLISMEKSRVRGDFIQVFKILKGVDKLDYSNFFEIQTSSRTKGHNYKLIRFDASLSNCWKMKIINAD